VQQRALGLLLPAQELAVPHFFDLLNERLGHRAWFAGRLEHLVEEGSGLILGESHGGNLL